MTDYQSLLEPGQIGNVKTKNRIFKTGAGSTLGDGSGKVTQRHKAFYGALARGGVGLIVVESGSIDRPPEAGLASGGGAHLRFDNDTFIPSFKELRYPVFGLSRSYRLFTILYARKRAEEVQGTYRQLFYPS